MGPFWLVSIISVCNKISYGNFSNSSGNYTSLLEVLPAVPAIIHHCLTFNNSSGNYTLLLYVLPTVSALYRFGNIHYQKKCGADFSAPHPVNTFYSVVSNKFKSLFSPVPPYRDRVYFRIQTTLDTILAV